VGHKTRVSEISNSNIILITVDLTHDGNIMLGGGGVNGVVRIHLAQN